VADNKTGYFGVQIARPGQPKPYQARVRRGGKYVYLGCFVTAEEAALCVARSPKGQAVAAERAAAAATLTNQPRSSGYRRTTCCVSPQLLQPELPIVFQQLCCTTIAVFHHNCCVSPQLLCFTTIAVFLSVYDGYTLSLKLQQLPEADGVAMLRFLRVLNPRKLVTGNVVSFHKHRAVVLVWLLTNTQV
jgi:hypothetical protein